jgi:hypothetical protein
MRLSIRSVSLWVFLLWSLLLTNRESYLKGYIEGVIDLWTEVSEKT